MSLAALVGAASAIGSERHTQPPVVDLCELVSTWKTYHGREIQVRAIYTEQVVQERLYDPNCAEVGEIAVKWPPRLTKTMKRTIRNLDRLVSKDSHKRAWVVVEGVFYGPEAYKDTEIPSNLPPAMKEQMKKSHKRYGYMNGLDNMIEITRVVEASRVDADVPVHGGAAPR
jgi:CRISPR/Cas system-associated endonuclease/helicase Cas3